MFFIAFALTIAAYASLYLYYLLKDDIYETIHLRERSKERDHKDQYMEKTLIFIRYPNGYVDKKEYYNIRRRKNQ